MLALVGVIRPLRGVDQGVQKGSASMVFGAAAAFLAVSLLDWGVMWGSTRQTGRTAERLLLALRVRIFAHLQRLSVDYYDREMAGRIMTRPAPNTPMTGWMMVEPASGTLKRFLRASSVPFWMARGTSLALP